MFKLKTNSFRRSNSAFTIVELLVVIVVIGILAAITIVSYTGISNRATISSIQSDLTNASTQLKIFNVGNSIYPATISTNCTTQPDTATNKCLKPSNGITYSYYVDNTASKQNFCVTATKDNYSYSINNTGTVIPAAYCPVLYLDAGNAASYPGSGTAWTDLSGNNNNSTLNGGVSYSAVNGGVLVFDGVNDYVDSGNNSTIRNITDKITVSAWVNYNAYGGGGQPYSVITSKGPPWTWLMEDPSQMIRFRITAGGVDTYAQDSTVHELNRWYYFVGTYDGANIKIYKDGVQVGITAKTGVLGTNDITSKIGTFQSTSYNFNGFISDVRVYNKALLASEIIQDFNATKGRYGL